MRHCVNYAVLFKTLYINYSGGLKKLSLPPHCAPLPQIPYKLSTDFKSSLAIKRENFLPYFRLLLGIKAGSVDLRIILELVRIVTAERLAGAKDPLHDHFNCEDILVKPELF